MGGNVERIKERVDIAELISGYVKLEKAGANFKARCPFHNEKTPSFHISPSRQAYYCFGCGAKGDIFTFVEEMEGVDFRGALKYLADKAGIRLEHVDARTETQKDKILEVLEDATRVYRDELSRHPEALKYLEGRGVSLESIESWSLGFAPDEWRALYTYLVGKGYSEDILVKAGLAKRVENDSSKPPYDVFRSRIIFPLSDVRGRVIAYSGRAFGEGVEPKYLNSPDTPLFIKKEVLYGLDKAKDIIRKKNYAVLVEGQLDLVLSHQAGVTNAVASSGTAFTPLHLERLKRFSSRIILAFDGDSAGEEAAYKSTQLGLSLGMEVKVAGVPPGSDPAELVKKDPELWKSALRDAKPAIEYFLDKVMEREQDKRKQGQAVARKILPLMLLVPSAIERGHFVSLVAKRTGIREEILWEDLGNTKVPDLAKANDLELSKDDSLRLEKSKATRKQIISDRLAEIDVWLKEFEEGSAEAVKLGEERSELASNLEEEVLRERHSELHAELSQAELEKDEAQVNRLSKEIQGIHSAMRALEEGRKKM